MPMRAIVRERRQRRWLELVQGEGGGCKKEALEIENSRRECKKTNYSSKSGIKKDGLITPVFFKARDACSRASSG